MRILRSIGAVAFGYLIFAIPAFALFQIAGRDPHAPQPLGFTIFSIVYGMAFAALGGYVAARLSPSRPRTHAGAVGILLAAGAFASLMASPGSHASWSQWAALILMAPSAYLGGTKWTSTS